MFFIFLFGTFINCRDTKDREPQPEHASLTFANLQLHNSRDNTEESKNEADQYSETESRASSKRSSFDRKVSKRAISFETGELGPEETGELSDNIDGSPRKKKGVKRLKERPPYRDLEDPDTRFLPIAPRTLTPMPQDIPKDEAPAEQEPEVISEDEKVEPSDPGTVETTDTESEIETPDEVQEQVNGSKTQPKRSKEVHHAHKRNGRHNADRKGKRPNLRRREMPEYVKRILRRKYLQKYDEDEENDADDEEFDQEE